MSLAGLVISAFFQLKAFLWIRPCFPNSLLGIFELMFHTNQGLHEGIHIHLWIPLFSICNSTIYSLLVVLMSRKRIGRRGWRRIIDFAWSHSTWAESPLMPFPAAVGLLGSWQRSLTCVLFFFRKEAIRYFAFSFLSSMIHPVHRFRFLFFRACSVILILWSV